jgi:hypothetical protein
MRPLKRILLLLALVLLAAGLIRAISQKNADPVYNGRPLSEWLERAFPAHRGDIEDFRQATNAVLAIGTNALPALTRWVAYEPTKLDLWVAKHSFTLANRLSNLEGRLDQARLAVRGFSILGPAASPAAPALIRLMQNTNSPGAGANATIALAGLGPVAIPPLTNAMLNPKHPLRLYAIVAAGTMHYLGSNATPLVPILVAATRDTDPAATHLATLSLGGLALQPETSLPVLARALTNPVTRYSGLPSPKRPALLPGPEPRHFDSRPLTPSKPSLPSSSPTLPPASHLRLLRLLAAKTQPNPGAQRQRRAIPQPRPTAWGPPPAEPMRPEGPR